MQYILVGGIHTSLEHYHRPLLNSRHLVRLVMWGWKQTIIWEEGQGSATPDYDHLRCEGGSKIKYESHNTVWTVGFVQALQLVLRLYRVMVLGWILCRKFGAPVPSAVPSAGTRQVQNSSLNDGSPSSHDQSPPDGTATLE